MTTRHTSRPPISNWRYSALLLPLITACLTPARDRAERDENIGQARHAEVSISVQNGLASIREISAQRIVIWQSAPRLELTLDSKQGFVELEVHNSPRNSELAWLSGAAVDVSSTPSEVPTHKTYQLSWNAAGPVQLRLGPEAQLAEEERIQPFRFALMSDVQEAIDDVQDLYQQMNSDSSIEFLLGAGDLTQRGTHVQLARFESELQSLNIPYYTTLGNHELGESPPPFQKRFGRASFSFSYRGARFTLLDSASATLDTLVLDRLDAWLALGQEQLHVVAMHIPPIDPTGIRSGSFASRNEANNLLSKLIDGAVDLTLYGHIHSYVKFENAGIPARISGGGGAIPERFDDVGRHYLAIDVNPTAQTLITKLVALDEDESERGHGPF